MEPQANNATPASSGNATQSNASALKLSDFFTKDIIRTGVVSGLILGAVALIGAILGTALALLLSIVAGVLTVVFGMCLTYAMGYKQEKLVDAVKSGVAAGLITGLITGVVGGIGSVIYLSSAYNGISGFFRINPPYVETFFNSFLVNGLVGTTIAFAAGAVVALFVTKSSLPKEVVGIFDKIGKFVVGK